MSREQPSWRWISPGLRRVLVVILLALLPIFWLRWQGGKREEHPSNGEKEQRAIQADGSSRASVNRDAIMALLGAGEFAKAQSLIHRLPKSPAKLNLLTTFNTSLHVDARLQYQKDSEAPSPIFPLAAPQLTNLVLTHTDNYRFFVSVSHTGIYLYLFQQDRFGQINRLFPDPVWSRTVNPIDAGATYRIPPGEKEWLYLDQLPPNQETAIQETLYIIASPWPASDLENLYGDMHRATSPEHRAQLLEQFHHRLGLRADPSLQAVYHQMFSFKHEG